MKLSEWHVANMVLKCWLIGIVIAFLWTVAWQPVEYWLDLDYWMYYSLWEHLAFSYNVILAGTIVGAFISLGWGLWSNR
jgi:hypothetical protein